MRISLI